MTPTTMKCQLVTDTPVEFEKTLVEVQGLQENYQSIYMNLWNIPQMNLANLSTLYFKLTVII